MNGIPAVRVQPANGACQQCEFIGTRVLIRDFCFHPLKVFQKEQDGSHKWITSHFVAVCQM